MAFQISPGVNVQETDLTTIVPAVATTEGAIGGVFSWGPVDRAVMVGSETELVARYGTPTEANSETFGVASSFLAYGNRLFVSRAVSNTAANAVGGPSGAIAQLIRNDDEFASAIVPANVNFIAKYPGTVGNGLLVSVCDNAAAFRSTVASGGGIVVDADAVAGSTALTVAMTGPGADAAATAAVATLTPGDLLTVSGNVFRVASVGSASVGVNNAAFTVTLATPAPAAITNATSFVREWQFAGLFDRAPGTSTTVAAAGRSGDEMHVVVVDVDGRFSNGAANSILQTFAGVSRATDARGDQGGSLFFRDVINRGSPHVWVGSNLAGLVTGPATTMAPLVGRAPATFRLTGGADGANEATIDVADLTRAYSAFRNAERIDVSLIMQGKARGGTHGEGLANWLIDNVAEFRKDCVVFVSPSIEDVVGSPGNEVTNVVEFRRAVRSSSYAVMDSGYKFMYDRYNDRYRFVPLNGDVAGLAVRTDETTDPWFSPAGFNRGQIRNVVKLAFSPDKTQRDSLYKEDVNPVVSFVGQGVVLYGDKTLLGRPSAFDRINVRRLFIVLEKAVATASKFSLFEFNDPFTRARFRNLVEPFLRDVQGRRGIIDFRVVCDETNNTGEVVDRNEFVGDIFIKPARSINFINLRFTAVRTGVEFSEIVGGN